MKTTNLSLLPVMLLATIASALAEVHYVDVNSTNATPPYTNWATAATHIQDAVDAAVAGDEIVVTNGIYATGGRDGNIAKVDKPLNLRSVNGPQFTIIDGHVGSGFQFRCAYLASGASLSGFTLTNGSDHIDFPTGGGGVFCESVNAVVSNCVITGNTSSGFEDSAAFGGGAYGGTLNNCTLNNNRASVDNSYGQNGPLSAYGGGAYGSTLNNCTLTSNSVLAAELHAMAGGIFAYGGGAYGCTLNNCTITGNRAFAADFTGRGDRALASGGGASGGTLNNCIVYFNNSTNGANYDISCTLNYSCTTPQSTSGNGNITNAPLFVDTNGWANLRPQSNSPCINAGNNAYAVGSTDLDGNPRIVGGTVDIGAYEFQAVRYVDVNSTNATPPYSSWATAATNIQDAVDAAVAGDEIVVTNGTYGTGGRSVDGVTTNRVAVDKPLNIRSINGPQPTIILGAGLGAGRFANNRCVYLTNGASLSGFTLTNGYAQNGGGVYCLSQTAVVFNCVISGNNTSGYGWGYASGGGAYGGMLNNCTLTGNSAIVEADDQFNVYWEVGGGGAAFCILNNCALEGNSATVGLNFGFANAEGGGAYRCTLNNCTLTRNSATDNAYYSYGTSYAEGGGAWASTLNNCTVTGNSAYDYVGGAGGGVSGCTMRNCIVSFNAAKAGTDVYSSGLDHCWTPSDPLFVDTNGWANLRLQSNSPCINAGNNASVVGSTDLDGNPRIAGGTVDIGAYEFQSPASMISYAWLQQFNLPINPATDAADPDHDGVDNYHEWLAGTDPTNPLSSPAQLTILPSGTNVILTWSTNAVGFTLQSATNLVSPAIWSTNSPAPVVIGGQNVVTNPLSGPQQFYRLTQ